MCLDDDIRLTHIPQTLNTTEYTGFYSTYKVSQPPKGDTQKTCARNKKPHRAQITNFIRSFEGEQTTHAFSYVS